MVGRVSLLIRTYVMRLVELKAMKGYKSTALAALNA